MATKNLSVTNLPKVSVVAQTLSLEQNVGEEVISYLLFARAQADLETSSYGR